MGPASVTTCKYPSPLSWTALNEQGMIAYTTSPLPLLTYLQLWTLGAQSNLWALSDFLTCGFSQDYLYPIQMGLPATFCSRILVEGSFFAKLTTKSPKGMELSCRSMAYISSSVQDLNLVFLTMRSCPQCQPQPFACTLENYKWMRTWLLE